MSFGSSMASDDAGDEQETAINAIARVATASEWHAVVIEIRSWHPS